VLGPSAVIPADFGPSVAGNGECHTIRMTEDGVTQSAMLDGEFNLFIPSAPGIDGFQHHRRFGALANTMPCAPESFSADSAALDSVDS